MADPRYRSLAQSIAGVGSGNAIPDAPFGDYKRAISGQYPALAPHMDKFSVQWGENNPHGGSLEFFPPWELHNPNPGQPTIELYNRDLKGNELQSAIAGDALHYLGAVGPSGNPVDPTFHGMKQQMIGSLTPDQLAVDRRAYDKSRSSGDHRSFDDWMQDSRGDAYIRGYITPDANDEWRKQGVYNPEQKKLLDAMNAYLRGVR